MTIGRIMEYLGDLLRRKVRFVLHIKGGGGRINEVKITTGVDLK